jgi:8-oxo-dGTP pyrophosphatase MutT (NUDIX family)
MKKNVETKEYNFVATLVFLLKGKKVWLAPKKAKIGERRLNGPGGELEESDASLKACAIRETHQEFGVHVKEEDLELCTVGYFTNIRKDGISFVCKVYIYSCSRYVGIPKASKETGRPRLFSTYALPLKRMMVADRFWIREFFKGKRFIVRATMKNHQSELIGKVEMEYIDSFN